MSVTKGGDRIHNSNYEARHLLMGPRIIIFVYLFYVVDDTSFCVQAIGRHMRITLVCAIGEFFVCVLTKSVQATALERHQQKTCVCASLSMRTQCAV